MRLGIKYSDFELPSSFDGESGFHISCYRRFNALSQSICIKIKRKSPKKKLVSCVRRSEIKSPSPATTSGVLEKLCLFCCQKSKKKNNKRYTLVNWVTDEFEKNIKKFAVWREDHRLLAKIKDICFSAKEVCYHSICCVEYENIAKATPLAKEELSLKKTNNGGEMKEQPSLWHQTRNAHKKAFVALADHITEEVINGKEVLFVAGLGRFYEELVNDLIDDESEISCNARKLEGKKMNYFGDRIQLVRAKTIRGNLICDKKHTTEEAIRLSDKQNIQIKIRDVALFLRREVLQADYLPLPSTVSLEDIRKGEVNTPEDLVKFFRYLVGGPYVGRELTAPKSYRITSIFEVVVFAAI